MYIGLSSYTLMAQRDEFVKTNYRMVEVVKVWVIIDKFKRRMYNSKKYTLVKWKIMRNSIAVNLEKGEKWWMHLCYCTRFWAISFKAYNQWLWKSNGFLLGNLHLLNNSVNLWRTSYTGVMIWLGPAYPYTKQNCPAKYVVFKKFFTSVQ